MIHHVVGLFTHPDQEWKEIRGDQEESISHMYLTHTLILAAIPAVSAFIGTTQVGWVIGNRAPVMLTVGKRAMDDGHVVPGDARRRCGDGRVHPLDGPHL